MYSNISKYDEALKNLIKKVYQKEVIYEPVDTAFEYAFKQTDNNQSFPMISLFRNPSVPITDNNFTGYNRGVRYQDEIDSYNENMEKIGSNENIGKNVKFLYIDIGYQIDVWGLDRLTTEQVSQELIFWIYENQQISSSYDKSDLQFSMTPPEEIIDNTDLVSYKTNGKLYRNTLNVTIRATLMRSENYFNVLKPDIDVGIKNI